MWTAQYSHTRAGAVVDKIFRYLHNNYDHESAKRYGKLVRQDGSIDGKPWNVNATGMVNLTVRIFGEKYLAHRLIWLFVNGEWPPNNLEFIDGNGCNCAPENLRLKNKTARRRAERKAR